MRHDFFSPLIIRAIAMKMRHDEKKLSECACLKLMTMMMVLMNRNATEKQNTVDARNRSDGESM